MQQVTNIFFILLFPILWILASTPWKIGPNLFTDLENKTINWRFQYRGEQPAPVKIFYISIDTPSLQMMGKRPWNLDFFADITQIAFKVGKAKALGFHLVFSDQYHQNSSLLDPQKFQEAQIHFASALFAFAPQVVLGVQYTDAHLEYLQDGNISRWGPFPYLRNGYTNPNTNPYPEVPSYPLIGPNWGRMAFLEYDHYLSHGSTPRWIPLFSQFKGGSHALAVLTGMRDATNMPLDAITFDEEDYILKQPNGNEIAQMNRFESHPFYAFGLELLLAYHNLDDSAIQLTNHQLTILNTQASENPILYQIPLTYLQSTPITWFSKWNHPAYNPSINVATLYQHFLNIKNPGTRAYEEAQAIFKEMENAIVIVANADPTIDDFIHTPFDKDPVPSVSLQGNFIKTIASQTYLQFLSPFQNNSITFGLPALMTIISYLLKRKKYFKNILISVLFIGYPLLTFWIFKTHHLVLPLTLPIFATISSCLISLFFHILNEKKQKSRIKDFFGTYVSPTVVHELIAKNEDPKLGGSDRFITAFFSDIENFAHFSEKLAPSDLVTLMNEYFEAMTTLIQKENGTLDKYIGDAIVAIFGAPLNDTWHALSACIAACQIQTKQAELALMWSRQGNRWPKPIHQMKTRIGLNSGFATVGNMGSSHRFNYTMMGDNVNLASRTEQAGKFFGTGTTLTQHTYKETIHKADICLFRHLGPTLLPGKSTPVHLYELVGLKDNTPDAIIESIEYYEKAVESYFKRHWATALKHIHKAISLESTIKHPIYLPHDSPSHYLQNRILKTQSNPPDKDWKALWTL